MTKINIYFDKEGDFLELSFGKPRPTYGEHIGKDTFEMRDKETDEIVGYTFHNVSKRKTKESRNIEVEIPAIS